jgi:CheY-like chemotaxis protein
MVVDDDKTIRELIKSILERDGISVIIAENGEKALELVNETPPNLVLMDINMPGMDGYEATRKIKDLPGSADLPVIFLTGRSAEEDAGRSFAHGAFAFVRKPFSPKQLSDLVTLTLQSLA